MVERIRQILQTRQLSPTQFADALGLARPIISHILSGRNKPSLEVVQKIIAAFPDLSLPWLLTGQGPMVTAAVAPAPVAATATATPAAGIAAGKTPQRAKRVVRSVAPEAAPVVPAPVVPAPQTAPAEVPPVAPAPAQVEAPPAVAPTPSAPNPSYSAVVTTPQNAPQVSAAPTTAVAPDMLAAFAEPGKTIRRIVIFYNDGTFSAYQPEVS